MLEVEKAIGGGDREAMETWFERAMKANGNDRDACWSKLDWLDPKWYGGDSWDAMLAFGKACRATEELAGRDHPARRRRPPPLFQRLRPERAGEVPEKAGGLVRHSTGLRRVPEAFPQRRRRAEQVRRVLLHLARYPEAHAQFQILGDRLTTWSTFPFYPIESLKRMREDAARFVAGKPREDADTAAKGDNPGKP